mmetsp:Transcript_29603/g.62240  ORF Transcript_29603/g.62240 Transcript_29603/m.62240 type:complete len:272 (-) Transcript_29603:193-1008(-)
MRAACLSEASIVSVNMIHFTRHPPRSAAKSRPLALPLRTKQMLSPEVQNARRHPGRFPGDTERLTAAAPRFLGKMSVFGWYRSINSSIFCLPDIEFPAFVEGFASSEVGSPHSRQRLHSYFGTTSGFGQRLRSPEVAAAALSFSGGSCWIMVDHSATHSGSTGCGSVACGEEPRASTSSKGSLPSSVKESSAPVFCELRRPPTDVLLQPCPASGTVFPLNAPPWRPRSRLPMPRPLEYISFGSGRCGIRLRVDSGPSSSARTDLGNWPQVA